MFLGLPRISEYDANQVIYCSQIFDYSNIFVLHVVSVSLFCLALLYRQRDEDENKNEEVDN